jgi:hypothetical protein
VTRRSTAARRSFILLALVQLLLPPVAAWMDARLERESSAAGGSRIHVEAEGTKGCVPVHPADCALCRASLATFTRPAASPLLLAERPATFIRPTGARANIAAAYHVGDSQPRAPPLQA